MHRAPSPFRLLVSPRLRSRILASLLQTSSVCVRCTLQLTASQYFGKARRASMLGRHRSWRGRQCGARRPQPLRRRRALLSRQARTLPPSHRAIIVAPRRALLKLAVRARAPPPRLTAPMALPVPASPRSTGAAAARRLRLRPRRSPQGVQHRPLRSCAVCRVRRRISRPTTLPSSHHFYDPSLVNSKTNSEVHRSPAAILFSYLKQQINSTSNHASDPLNCSLLGMLLQRASVSHENAVPSL